MNFWAQKLDYNQNPIEQSSIQLKQNKKYWAKNDQILISDTKKEQAQQDPFKKIHISLKKSKEVTEKALTKNYAPKGIPHKAHKFKQGQRWTESEIKYKLVKNRLFDDIPQYPDMA